MPVKKRRRRSAAPKKKAAAPKCIKNTVTAGDIDRLLRARYDDRHYTTSEIQGVTGNGRLDFVAIQASWSNPNIHGFEVKVSRSDFMHDDKWPAYLDSCQQFWFVTAPGVCSKEEIPEQAGWIEATKNGAKLLTRKKAPLRTMTDAHRAKLFRQIIHRLHYKPYEDTRLTREQQRETFLAAAADKRELSTRIGAAVRETVEDARRQAKQARDLNAGFEALHEALKAKGITDSTIISAGKVKRLGNNNYAAGAIIEKVCPELKDTLGPQLRSMQRVLAELHSASARHNDAVERAVHVIEKVCKTKEDDQS